MTSITWPQGLPDTIRLEGLNGKRQSNVIRTSMDAGPDKARQRYSVSTKKFTGSVILNGSQRKALELWYKSTLACGVLRFVMKDPQTSRPAEFRFTDDYEEESTGDGLWMIKLPLEKLNA